MKMKIIKHVIVSLFALVLFFVNSVPGAAVFAEEQNKELSEEQQKVMKLWQKYTTPGENHKHLEYYIGDWESIQKIFPEPGAEPVIRKQEINVKSIFGGRFLKAHIKGKNEIMGISPETIVITGYDNYKKEFFALSYGNMGTRYHITCGTLDKTGKIRTETGGFDDLITGKKIKVKAVTTIIDRDKYVYLLYQIDPSGNESRLMEITYTRK
ncbi:MAG: DUF1579 family protein [Candidatus Aminicenantes bacterium]|nr:MAG: DUF1579 family protein [Candidatus Aminicenantes bacterium]